MLILVLRTDKPEAELGLFDDNRRLAYIKWPAHRELAEAIHKKIDQLLKPEGKSLNDIEGIVVFKGPGSFTGLRIGITVANALAYSQKIPIVARGELKWLETGLKNILSGQNDRIAIPEYGAPAVTSKRQK
jgi:tRNA threonylcarbamoyladenosine biosynthesis protein TsaB